MISWTVPPREALQRRRPLPVLALLSATHLHAPPLPLHGASTGSPCLMSRGTSTPPLRPLRPWRFPSRRPTRRSGLERSRRRQHRCPTRSSGRARESKRPKRSPSRRAKREKRRTKSGRLSSCSTTSSATPRGRRPCTTWWTGLGTTSIHGSLPATSRTQN